MVTADEISPMRTISGISLISILLLGSLVSPIGILSAFGTSQTIPHSPTLLNATSVSGTQIFLMWTPPVNATKDGVSGYKIEISQSCSNSFNFLVNTTSTSFLSSGLINGTCYQFRVSAINSVGLSSPSNVALATTLSVPSAPTNLVALAVSSSQINLSWSSPANSGGVPINGYKIERKNSCASIFSVIANTGNASTIYSDTGLSANTCYQYRVLSHNAIGTGLPSNNATAITKSSLQTHVASAPTGLSITVISSSSLKLTWNAPSDDGGSPITGYLIQRNGTAIVTNTFSHQTMFTNTNLLPHHQETYRVAAWNDAGLGAFSNTATGTTANSTKVLPPGNGNNTNATTTLPSNLGQLVSDFVHKRNLLLKQQRTEIVNMIHECNAKIKNAAKDDRKQIHEECKAKIKELREQYKDLRAKLNEQFKELRDKFKSQMHESIKFGNATSVAKHLENETKSEKGNKQSEKENEQSENENKQSENKSKQSDQGIANSAKEMKQFKELKNKGRSEDHKKGHQNE